MAFDENHYKKIFEQRYGKGSFDAGLQQARQIGQLKAQAELAKKNFKAQKDAEEKAKKAADEQKIVYGSMTAKEATDLQQKAQAEGRGGYSPSYENARKETMKNSKEQGLSPYTETPSNYNKDKLTPYALQKLGYKTSWDAPKKKDESLFGKTKDFFTSKDTNHDGKPDGLSALVDKIERPRNAIDTGIKALVTGHNPLEGIKKGWTGKTHTSGTDLNSSLGFNPDKNKTANIAARLLGRGVLSEIPGIGVATPLLNNKLKAKAGKEIAGFATEMATDPINLIGSGLVSKGLKGIKLLSKGAKATGEADKLLGLPSPQLKLNAPQLQLSAPKEIKPSLDALMKIGKKPNGLDSPIPSMPKVMSQAIKQNEYQKAGLGFGYNTKLEPKARGLLPKLNVSSGDSALLGRKGDAILNTVSKLEGVPTGHYEKRLLQVQKEMKAIKDKRPDYFKPLNIDELYQRVKQPNDPETFDKLVKLNEMEVNVNKDNPIQGPQQATLKDHLNSDPRIKEQIKGFFPPVSPEPKVSRPATLNEIVNEIERLTPPKQPIAEPTPLNFRVPKGFNPNTPTNILNRPNTPLKGLEAINKGKVKTNAINPKITDVQDTHGYGLIDTQAHTPAPIDYNNKVALENRLSTLRDEVKKPNTKVKKDAIRKEILGIRQGLDVLHQKNLTESNHTFNDLLANSDNWKDKPAPLYKRETMARNFEDVMGPQDSQKLKEIMVNPVGREEAKSIKFQNVERDLVRAYNIKGNTNESALAQKYGEGLISLNDLKGQTKNWKDVVKLSEHLQKTYDKVFPMMNKALVENGYPPVPYRKNYFPHTKDLTTFEKFLKEHVGIDFTDHTLPTDINGLTGDFKPGKQFFGHSLERKGDKTAYDAIAAFDKYLNGASNVIFHTKNIKRFRAFEKAIRDKYPSDGGNNKHLANFVSELEQYTNMLAGKKVGFDHTTEKYTGRHLYSFVDNMRKRESANMLAYNLSTPISNLIPVLTQAPALIGKKYFIKGMADTLANVVKKDGFETDFLTRRNGSDPLYRTLWGNVTDKGFYLMKVVDKFASQTIVRGKYYELLDKGVAPNVAKKQADELASKIMADRSKGQMPTLFADRTLSLFTQFQLETNNQMSFMFKDIPRMAKNKAAMASAYAQVFLYSYLFNDLTEKLTGRRVAFDPVGVVKNAIGDYNNDNLSKGQATFNTTKNISAQLPFASMFTGGRYPIEAGLPSIQNIYDKRKSSSGMWKQAGKEMLKPATYLLPPTGGGAIKKVLQTANDFGLNPLSPQPATGVYQTDSKGNKVMQYPIKNNPLKTLQELSLGRSSLNETRDYFNNNRRALTPKQTRQLEGSSQPLQDYQNLQQQRRIDTIAKKLKSLNKENLPQSERIKKFKDLTDQLKKIREGK